jgi:hypothetical protein
VQGRDKLIKYANEFTEIAPVISAENGNAQKLSKDASDDFSDAFCD